ncbi:hypothetical protein R6Q59_004809 [Mikania micrantha]
MPIVVRKRPSKPLAHRRRYRLWYRYTHRRRRNKQSDGGDDFDSKIMALWSLVMPPPVMPRHREDVEGGGQVKPKMSLLDRYLDDQLELALDILHECNCEILKYG